MPLLALAACGKKDDQADNQIANDAALPAVIDQIGATPMAERVAVLGLLNKRNGIVRDLTLKPGQSIRVKDVVVRLRACETSAPWEAERLTGAFVQVFVRKPGSAEDANWPRVFSGWLFKNSPSLNVVEHPVYDVWVKDCAMKFPGEEEEAAPSASNAAKPSGNVSQSATPAPPPATPSPSPAASPRPSAPATED